MPPRGDVGEEEVVVGDEDLGLLLKSSCLLIEAVFVVAAPLP